MIVNPCFRIEACKIFISMIHSSLFHEPCHDHSPVLISTRNGITISSLSRFPFNRVIPSSEMSHLDLRIKIRIDSKEKSHELDPFRQKHSSIPRSRPRSRKLPSIGPYLYALISSPIFVNLGQPRPR